MSTEELTVAALVLAPMVVLGIVGMVRGYHLNLKVWKYNKEDSDGDH